MVDKINRSSPVYPSRSVKRSEKDKQEPIVKSTSPDIEPLILEESLKPSQTLITLVQERGPDFARRQLIREILVNKFGEGIQASAEFQMTLEKLYERIEKQPELKEYYNDYLKSLI